MILRLLLFPVALVVEAVAVVFTGKECGLGNFVFDRKPGDPVGKILQTREQAIAQREQEKNSQYETTRQTN